MLKSKDLKLILSDIDIMSKMEPFIDALILSGVYLTLMAFLTMGFTTDFLSLYTLSNGGLFAIIVVLYLLRGKIKVEHKVSFMIFALMISGTISFHIDGLFGIGSFLLLAGILLSVIFLKVKTALFITFLSSMKGVHYLTVLVINLNPNNLFTITEFELLSAYIFVYIGILLVTITIFVAVAALKKFLLSSLETVNMQIRHMEMQNNHLLEMNKEVEYLAYHNSLTSLHNKEYFKSTISKYIASDMQGILVLADIKNFQNINAFYGTDFGDYVLKTIGIFLREKYRDSGEVAYLGNNSFAFWIPYEMTGEELEIYYRENINELKDNKLLDLELDFYIVAALKMDFMRTYDDLYTVADKAMKLVKRNNQDIVFIDQNYLDEIRHFEEYVNFLKLSISNDSFDVYYQEKVNSETMQVVGLEALARIKRDGEVLMPSEFVPIIEESGLASSFGQTMMNKIFSQFKEVTKLYGDDVVVSLNVSPHQLSDPNFITSTNVLIEKHNLSRENFMLEITENILLQDMKRSVAILKELRSLGFSIAIDDFGTGYSSMSYISELPVDVIKIDKSFIDKILTSKKTKSVIKSIIEVAHINDMVVVAEGVEVEEQVKVLEELHCYIIQGYLFSHPEPMDNKTS